MRKIFLILLTFVLLITFTPNSFAAENFSTDYNVTYNIKSNADTRVDINVILTNLSDNYYASSYDIDVGFKDLRNLSSFQLDEKINSTVMETKNGSKIHIPFSQKIVGRNSKLNFNVSFDTNEIAQNLTNVWDINIPGISKKSDFANFKVTVNYPSFLGKPAYIKPALPHVLINLSGNSINFSREDLGESGISLAFGSYQVYDFDLTYHLQNKNLFNIKTEIALPPSTNYQDVQITKMNPMPLNVYIDNDGNWLAQYDLKSSQKLDVKVIGQAKVYLNPKEVNASKEQLEKYLQQESYWETNENKIKELSKRLKTPKAIYDYVVKALNYDFSRVETQSPRLGALGALNNPNSAVCLEFTDLFIALARSAGIPARSVNGYAYTENSRQRPLSFIKDVLHAWPEYYDSNRSMWVMVDPTWGNTTNGVDYFDVLDFDHFTFVKNGIKSSYPIPAGGYKYSSDLNVKDVNVSMSSRFKEYRKNLLLSLDISQNHIAGFPIKGKINIENNSGVLSNTETGYVYSDKLSPNYQIIEIPVIPPFGKAYSNFGFNKTDALTNEADAIRISVDGKSAYKNIYISPFFLDKWFLLGGVLIVFFITAIPIAYTGLRRLYILRQRGKSNLRGEGNKPTEKNI